MPESIEPAEVVALPCRGCTADCANRARCGGLPWRLPREAEDSGENTAGAGQP